MNTFEQWLAKTHPAVKEGLGTFTMPIAVRRDNEDMPEPIPGLEGPFRFKSGKILYYDPKEGKYYDRSTDMYIDNDEMQQYLQ